MKAQVILKYASVNNTIVCVAITTLYYNIKNSYV